jgi:hypothetical protein
MKPLVEEVVEALRDAGWTVKLTGKPRPLPRPVANRHPGLPPLAVEFFTNVQSCVKPGEGAWFLAAEDFARTDGFRWDEYERMFLEDADEEQAQEVRAFWDGYLPIYQLVEGDYEYLALGTDPSSKHFGKVVWNAEAAYEEPLVITENYEDFLVRLRDVAHRDPSRTARPDITIARLIHANFAGVVRQSWWTRLKRWLRDGRR